MGARHVLNRIYVLAAKEWSEPLSERLNDLDAALTGGVPDRVRTQRLGAVLGAGGEVG